jgi:hypothetical protein
MALFTRKTRGGDMRDRYLRGNAGRATSSYRRSGAIARWSILFGGTAAMALLVGHPARAISINDGFFPNQVPTRDTVSNYYDNTNQFPNVAAPLFASGGTFCTGSLINSRTILTAAHCAKFELFCQKHWSLRRRGEER